MNVRVLFALNAVLLVLLAMSAPFVEIGSDTFVVWVASLVLVATSMSGLGALAWYGRTRQE